MKQLIITAVLVILGVYLANTFILGSSGSLKSEGKKLGEKMITELKVITEN